MKKAAQRPCYLPFCLFGLSLWARHLTAWAGLPGGGFYVLYFHSGVVQEVDLGSRGSSLGFQPSCEFFRSKTSPWEFLNPYFEKIFWLIGRGLFLLWRIMKSLGYSCMRLRHFLHNSEESIQILAKQKSPP